jgi:hypothetical protein
VPFTKGAPDNEAAAAKSSLLPWRCAAGRGRSIQTCAPRHFEALSLNRCPESFSGSPLRRSTSQEVNLARRTRLSLACVRYAELHGSPARGRSRAKFTHNYDRSDQGPVARTRVVPWFAVNTTGSTEASRGTRVRELSRERKQKPSYEPTAPGGRVRGRVSVLALLCSVLTSDTAAALTARHETSREPLQGMRLVFRSAFFSAGTSGWHAACGTVYCVIRGSSLALVARRCVQDHHRLVLSVVACFSSCLLPHWSCRAGAAWLHRTWRVVAHG